MKHIELNGTRYTEGSKCISCSSEVDKGGRFTWNKRVRPYLKCNKCSYSILSQKTRNKQENRLRQKSLRMT